MLQARRPTGRLFYWLVAMAATAGAVMGTAGAEDPARRAGARPGSPAVVVPQSRPALTSVVDTVYNADGSTALGILIITWPAFVSASGTAVAPGAPTTVTVDAGMAPSSGQGIEVRENDYGWGEANDRNLLGRFSTQTFTLARLAETQNYFLRLYDNSSPPRYSRYSAALHVDYPL